MRVGLERIHSSRVALRRALKSLREVAIEQAVELAEKDIESVNKAYQGIYRGGKDAAKK